MRTKVSSSHRAFEREIARWERFDEANQRAFSAASPTLSSAQLTVLTESAMARAFRAYESYVREVFLLYTRGKQTSAGKAVKSNLVPSDMLHAEQMMKQAKPFLDWSNPDFVIQRAELFLRSGAPISAVLSANSASLRAIKAVRNHIAHSSEESLSAYKKVVLAHFGAMPLSVPDPGNFLLLPSAAFPGMHLLREYMSTLRSVAKGLAG